MARSRSSKASGGDIMKQMQDLCGDNCDPLSIVCALVVIAYIGLANPSNTPAFFGSAVFKVLIFAVVVIVTLMDTKIGVIFGLAMVLSVSYSYIRPSPMTQEPFFEHEPGHEKEKEPDPEEIYPDDPDDPDDPDEAMTANGGDGGGGGGGGGGDGGGGGAAGAGDPGNEGYEGYEGYAPYQSM